MIDDNHTEPRPVVNLATQVATALVADLQADVERLEHNRNALQAEIKQLRAQNAKLAGALLARGILMLPGREQQ